LIEPDGAALEAGPVPAGSVICVDLDGSLCDGDTMVRCGIAVLWRKPWLAPRFLVWWMRGRARLKAEIALRAESFDPAVLRYHDELLSWLRAEKAGGRRLVIASGADRRVVAAVAGHLGLFDEIFASDGRINLTGPRKAAALGRRFAEFAYVGNSRADVAVWRRATTSYLVARGPWLAARLGRQVKFTRVFHSR
jgi:phosphoserine phosphatase